MWSLSCIYAKQDLLFVWLMDSFYTETLKKKYRDVEICADGLMNPVHRLIKY